MSTLVNDVRYAARMLWKDRRFTLVALVALALGIGGTSAVYTVVDAVLLRPLAFPASHELVDVRSGLRSGYGSSSYPDYVDLRARNRAFADVAAYGSSPVVLTGRGDAVHVFGLAITPSLLPTLGAQPLMGRGFTDADAVVGSTAVILSHALWQGRYRGDPDILGRAIGIDGKQAIVVGVMPPGFQFPIAADDPPPLVYLPFPRDENDASAARNRGGHAFDVVARLAPGTSLAAAHADLDAVAATMRRDHPAEHEDKNLTFDVRPLRDAAVRAVRPALLLLLAAIACVLLIACANVAGLLLARATVRRREIAIRSTLGATRGRIVRQLLTESLMLGLGGGAAGLLLALWLVDLLLVLVAPTLPRVHNVAVDGRVLGVTLAVAVVCSVGFGLVPALHASRVDLQEALKDATRAAGHASRRSRNALLVAEIAVALVLLFGAGLALRSFARLRHVDPGFRPDGLMVAQIDLPARYPKDEDVARYGRALARELSSLPGVDAVALGGPMPFSHEAMRVSVHITGQPPADVLSAAHLESVSGGYFAAMGIPLERGRSFQPADDDQHAMPVVIISEAFARALFPTESPIGRHISVGLTSFDDKGQTSDCEIVGVVGDVRARSLRTPPLASVYVPMGRLPLSVIGVVVRSRAPAAMMAPVRAAVLAVDHDLPPTLEALVPSLMDETLQSERMLMVLLGLFAGGALVLAVIGIYGVMSYTVTQRRREIGIRVAVGARVGQILLLVLGESVRLALTGVVIGVAAALALARLARSVWFGVSESDPLTLVAASLLLIVVGIAASLLPAWRATRVDPMETLRDE